jgi:hypothetical protein
VAVGEGLGIEVVSVLAQRATSEGPRWMRAMETTSMPNQSSEVDKGECAQLGKTSTFRPKGEN